MVCRSFEPAALLAASLVELPRGARLRVSRADRLESARDRTRDRCHNAWTYTNSNDFQQLLAEHSIKHLRTKPYRPQTNGKIERFHQTMGREWAYGMAYGSSNARAAALPHWIEHYNQQRTHSAIGAPPTTRAPNLSRQDS